MTQQLNPPARQQLSKAYAASKKRLLLLDYDGTLIDFAPTPEQASPTPQVLDTLNKLLSDPKNTVVLTSGRATEVLDGWFGHLPLNLVAEHGAFTKHTAGWQVNDSHQTEWQQPIRQLFEQLASANPGMLVENKTTALALHYRIAKDHSAAAKAVKQAAKELSPLLAKHQLRCTIIDETLEVRPQHINKGKNALTWLKTNSYDFVLAAGDSTTDEDMFESMPPAVHTVKIGSNPSIAKYRIASPAQFVNFLGQLTAPNGS
jgi:trehalose 6-phosphate synthase/phosphatase